MKVPLNVTQLNERLALVATEFGIPIARTRVMLCTLVISQMLPDSVAIKGGMGIKFRLGEIGTRATSDLDVSTRVRGAEFENAFRCRLAKGWGSVPPSKGELRRNPEAVDRVAFTGAIRAHRIHDPGLARPAYVMHPYRISLSFLGTPWAGLDVEASDPEISANAHTRHMFDNDLVEFGSHFGFGDLEPVAIVDVEYQIAQKIHAVTDPAYTRAHDLVDLQLLWTAQPDLRLLREMCIRTFQWRHQQFWPPFPLREMREWEQAYIDAREETEVGDETVTLPSLKAARSWLEEVIIKILDA